MKASLVCWVFLLVLITQEINKWEVNEDNGISLNLFWIELKLQTAAMLHTQEGFRNCGELKGGLREMAESTSKLGGSGSNTYGTLILAARGPLRSSQSLVTKILAHWW